jgi:DNA-binding transcriptional ArsR family regulator
MPAITDINDPRLVKALAHPLRVQILRTLEERTASPSELAEELGVPLPNLSYHIRMLVQLDLLKLVKTRPRRGAIEHYYQAKGKVLLTAKAWDAIPEVVKRGALAESIRLVARTVGAADLASPLTTVALHADRVSAATANAVQAELATASERIERLLRVAAENGDGENGDAVPLSVALLSLEEQR